MAKQKEIDEFHEKGGFDALLKQIFNPSDPSSIHLDSVFQLKDLVRDFYVKRQTNNSQLIQMLDAMSNQRPEQLKMKSKYFDLGDNDLGEPLEEALKWMRINTECERIQKFKNVAKDQALTYYNVLEKFMDLQENGGKVKQKRHLSPASELKLQKGKTALPVI